MKLSRALDVRRGEVVAFVGAGGKTSAMRRLAEELTGQGLRVLATTTTRIARDELDAIPESVALSADGSLPASLADLLERRRHVFLYSRVEGRKVRGVDPGWLDDNLLPLLSMVDAILIEADGARRLPLKAPKSHEPAMPISATIVVPVVGLNVLGQPLDEAHVYNVDPIVRHTGWPPAKPVEPELIAALLLNPFLGAKRTPPGARFAPLLNKVTDDTLPQARLIAQRALSDLNVDRVLIGSVQETDPIREAQRRIGAVVLAAGQSSRMGEPKMLLPWNGSLTIIHHVCQQVAACGPYEIVVVSGEWHDAIRKQVEGLPVRVVNNRDYAKGEMLSSLRVGLEAIWDTSEACMVVLGDQPGIQPDMVRALMLAYAEGRGRIVAPSYQNRRGHPIIIERAFWPSIMELPDDAAPRDVIRAHEDEVYHVVVDSSSVLRDIDTPEDYRQARSGSQE